MAWVRIHDGAMSHPKIVGLIDWRNPFCVWVWGLSYCQQHLTDGAIVKDALPNRDAVKTAEKLVAKGLWINSGDAFHVHDYLDWNNSRQVIGEKRASARERVTRYRERTDIDTVTRDERRTSSLGVRVGVSSDGSTPEDPEGMQGEPDRRQVRERRVGPSSRRIFLHRWQIDALIDTLGPHAADFALDEWLDALSHRAEVLPKDRWAWVQAELHAEVQRRGLPVAATAETTTNKRIAGLVAGGEAFLRRAAGRQS